MKLLNLQAFCVLMLSLTIVTCGCDGQSIDRSTSAASDGAVVDGGSIPEIQLNPAFSGTSFVRPVFVGHAGDGSGRLFVVEQPGRIKVIDTTSESSKTSVFLDIREKVRMRHNEEGLLSLAFHPDFKTNGRFFVYYSASDPRRGIVSAFTINSADPNAADPASEQEILEVEQPWGNHNGCSLVFGPDGYLYVSLGDGGAAADPLNNGQNLSTLLGSILRIDVDATAEGKAYGIPGDNPFVDQPDARDEIWAYGLRNVWRMSFDRKTGDLWAGDVGQNRLEEIDVIVKGGNYGWKIFEGTQKFGSGELPADAAACIAPVVEYGRRMGISITGGHVYRGIAEPSLQGIYFYADYASGRIWGLRYVDGAMTEHRQVKGMSPRSYISSFGEDEAGELYVCTFDEMGRRTAKGRLFRIVPR